MNSARHLLAIYAMRNYKYTYLWCQEKCQSMANNIAIFLEAIRPLCPNKKCPLLSFDTYSLLKVNFSQNGRGSIQIPPWSAAFLFCTSHFHPGVAVTPFVFNLEIQQRNSQTHPLEKKISHSYQQELSLH